MADVACAISQTYISVPFHTNADATMATHVIALTNMTCIISTLRWYTEVIAPNLGSLPSVKWIIIIDDAPLPGILLTINIGKLTSRSEKDARLQGLFSFTQVEELGRTAQFEKKEVPLRKPTDLVTISFTSGSTGVQHILSYSLSHEYHCVGTKRNDAYGTYLEK